MNNINRSIILLLMSALVLSLACGCKNNDTESTSSTASKTESSLSSNTESSKQSESKAESSKQSEASTDKDYEEMMSYVNKLSPELTYEQVLDIFGKPDEYYRPDANLGSGLNMDCYNFGKYTLRIINFNAGAEIYNSETKETTKIY